MIRRIVDPIARFLVGVLLIFSGLIKLNDPVGTEIKLEEYFEVFADSFGSFFRVFIPYSLELGMVLIVLEVVLGVAVLLYYRMNLTTKVLLALMVFFTFLTFYSAYFNKVTDCGCFGDAIKLNPWQSFGKDVFLMVFVLHLFWYRKSYIPLLRAREGHFVVGGVTAICFFLGIYAVLHLPYIDFRPYKIGNNIRQQMQPAEQPVIEYIFVKDGEEVRSLKFLSEKEGYTYKDSHVLNSDKIVPRITDYAVSTVDGDDVTPDTFEGAKLLFIIYSVRHASDTNISDIRTLMRKLDGDVEMMLLTSSSAIEIEEFRHHHQLPVPYYFADATVLKTIIRSNPGITLWVNGTVKGKWHHNDVPTAEEVMELINS